MSEASPKARSQQSAPTDWSTVPVSQQKPLITLLVQLAQRRLAKQLAEEAEGDERGRPQATR